MQDVYYMKTIFIHIIDQGKLNSIKELCTKLGIQIESIGNKDLGRSILSIISGDEKLPAKIDIPPMYNMPEVMIFMGFDETELKSFLNEYKKAGIEKVALKAMVTPYNVVWTLYYLIEHLKEEANMR
jgi:hypothetical protein